MSNEKDENKNVEVCKKKKKCTKHTKIRKERKKKYKSQATKVRGCYQLKKVLKKEKTANVQCTQET